MTAPLRPPGTVSWTFDNMAEAAAIGRGERSGPGPVEATDLHLAYPRLLTALDDAGLRCTFFLEGWSGLHRPQAVAELVTRGHDVGAHGWVHEVWSGLSPHDAQRLMLDSLAALRRAGAAPRAFRAPGGARTPATPALLEAVGLQVDSSLPPDGTQEPSQVWHDAGLAYVPYRWPQVDGFYYLHRHDRHRDQPDPTPELTLHDTWHGLLVDTARTGGHLTLIAHAAMSAADPRRLEVLTDLIGTSAALGLEHLTVEQAADHYRGASALMGSGA